ncbi:MAG TPA: condensation domain-containing protein [Jatrophihabitans sp.]|nr:condensation domain-containing protein [Jatrophihabitans sp.]
MAADAPLSFGQLYSWREVDSYPAGWKSEANLPATWDLRGFSAERVELALHRLFQWHEPLRTTYHLRDGVPVQRVHDDLEPPVERIKRLITSPRDADRTTTELLAIPFGMTGGLCWRGRLVSWRGAPMFLALSFSHLIMDVWSVQELHTQFRGLLANPDDPMISARLGSSPRQLAGEQRSEAGIRRQQSAERYWQRVLAERTVRLPAPPAGMERPRIQATLHSAQLAVQTTRAARELGVTPPSLLAALVAAGLGRQLAAPRVVLNLMSSNRFAPEQRYLVGTMNQLIPVSVAVDEDFPLAEHIARLHWAGAKAYRYSCYDLDRVTELITGDGSASGATRHFNELFQCWFNYLQLDTERPKAAARSRAELEWTPVARRYGQPFDVRVTARGGRLSVALRVDPDVIPADGLLDILRLVAAGVRQACLNPRVSLAQLWQTPDELPAELFPRRLPQPPARAAA